MNLGGIIDVAIGMSFIYLLLSLVCSGINELYAWASGLRAKTLRAGIAALLRDDALGPLRAQVYAHPLIKGLSAEGTPSYIPSSTFVRALLDTLVDKHPDLASPNLRRAIEALSTENVPAEAHQALVALLKKLPEDPTKEVSSATLRDAVAGARGILKTLPEPKALVDGLSSAAARGTLLRLLEDKARVDSVDEIRKVLASLPASSAVRRQLELFVDDKMVDVEVYRRRLERWFDSSMDRVSGLYKRKAQTVSIIVGVSLAIVLGVDSGTVGDALLHDGTLRQATVAAAVEAAKKAPELKSGEAPDEAAATKRMTEAFSRLDKLNLPIGLPYLVKAAPEAPPPPAVASPADLAGYWLLRLVGMLLTGLAISLGAPFWFDMMGKLTNLRSSGPPPAKADKSPTPGT